MRSNESGVITVYLSLCILLILSFVFTIVEGVRVTTAKLWAERTLSTAMDSTLANFYRPLMEEYHILGLYDKEIFTNHSFEDMENKINGYMSYTFDPNKNVDYRVPSIDLYQIEAKKVTLQDYTTLSSYDGEILQHQGIQFMKYNMVGDGVELLLDRLSLLETPKKVSVLYEEKLKVEEQLKVIDQRVLTLMKLLDGISTGKNGLERDKNGLLKLESHFVKMIYHDEITKESVGINQSQLFSLLKPHYQNPYEKLSQIDLRVAELQSLQQSMDQITYYRGLLNYEYNALYMQYWSLYQLLAEVQGRVVDKGKEAEKQNEINEIERSIDSISQDMTNLYRTMASYDRLYNETNIKKKQLKATLSEVIAAVTSLMDCVYPKIIESINTIDEIMNHMEQIDGQIRAYETLLQLETVGLSPDIVDGLNQGLAELKRYQSGTSLGYDFDNMRIILEKNLAIISSVKNTMISVKNDLDSENISSLRTNLMVGKQLLLGYQLDGLTIDYSTIVLETSEGKVILDTLENLMDQGILSIVMNPDNISQLKYLSNDLPSNLNFIMPNSQSNENLDSLSDSISFDGDGAGVSDVFGQFKSMTGGEILNQGYTQMTNHVLFWLYLKDHFDTYTATNDSSRKPVVLSYEREYLLEGKNSDLNNLSDVVIKVILMRAILNFTTLLGDKDKWNEAKIYAASLVGFTGLPVLVSIVQTVLMIVLALAESIIDVSALLMDKSFPLIKKKVKLEIRDLLKLNPTYIQSKAKEYSDKDGTLSVGYENYVDIFLILQKKKTLSYRAMDLIQGNIRKRYEDNFTISRCIYGFTVTAEFYIPPKFISIANMYNNLNHQFTKTYPVTLSYSY